MEELPPHLYRDAAGLVRDRGLEALAAALETGEAVDGAALTRYCAMFQGAPPLPEAALRDAAVALDWAAHLGIVSVTLTRPDQHPPQAERLRRLGLRYVAYFEATRRSAPAFARSIPLAVMGAVVQAMREQAATQNNLLRAPATRPN